MRLLSYNSVNMTSKGSIFYPMTISRTIIDAINQNINEKNGKTSKSIGQVKKYKLRMRD